MMRNWIVGGLLVAVCAASGGCGDEDLKKSASELGEKASRLADESKRKIVETFQDQIAEIDVEELKRRAARADAATRERVSEWIETLAEKKDAAAEAVRKLAEKDGRWDDLVAKAKAALGEVATLAEKIRDALAR